MRGIRRVLVPVAALAALAAAQPAAAARFCVSDADCVAAGGTSKATLQAAFDAAQANGAGLDQVEIGATTLNGGGLATSGNPVEVLGEGVAKTTVSDSGSVISITDPSSSIRDLTIKPTSAGGIGLNAAGTVERVAVSGTVAATGMQLSGAVASNVTVDLPAGINSTGIALAQAANTVQDSRLSADHVIRADGGTTTLRRLQITAGSRGATLATGATGSFESSTIRVLSGGIIGLSVQSNLFGAGTDLTARHLTVVGPGSGQAVISSASCGITNTGGTTRVNISDSIIRGWAKDFTRNGGAACPSSGSAVADVDAAFSIFDPAKVTQSGLGTFSTLSGNANVDPLLTSDLQLGAGSPAIDAGDPAALGATETTTDVAGAPRLVDGNGDGTARRDIGAFESAAVSPPPGGGDIARTLKLSYSKRKDLFKGKLKSADAACRAGKVVVLRKKPGPDKKVGSDRTSANGKWSFDEPDASGTFFAKVAASTVEAGTCLAAQSRSKTIR